MSLFEVWFGLVHVRDGHYVNAFGGGSEKSIMCREIVYLLVFLYRGEFGYLFFYYCSYVWFELVHFRECHYLNTLGPSGFNYVSVINYLPVFFV